MKSELELLVMFGFEQERAETGQRPQTPDPLQVEVNINNLDEAWFLKLEEVELIKAKEGEESSKRVRHSSALSCTVCTQPLNLHQRGNLRRSFLNSKTTIFSIYK